MLQEKNYFFTIFEFLYLYLYIHTYVYIYIYTYVCTGTNKKNWIWSKSSFFLSLYIYIDSLAFIRYTLLVPGWTPFASRTALILHGIDSTRCWKHSSEMLVHIDMVASRSSCRFVGYTSMMRISRSTTSQRSSIGLRSGDCGGHLN